MLLPLIAIAAGVGLLYLFMSEDTAQATPMPSSVKPAPGGMAQTTVPTADGRGFLLTSTPEDIAAIMTMATANDAGKLRIMGAQYRARGKHAEATACDHLAQVIELSQATGGRYSPKAETPAAISSQPPPELVAKLASAVSRGDTAAMRVIAAEMRRLGYPAQANAAEAAANISDELARTTAVVPPVVVSKPAPAPVPVVTPAPLPQFAPAIPKVVTTGLPKPEPAAPPTPRRAMADALVRHLTVDSPAKGKENKAIVRAYQKEARLTTDGLYGPGSARSLADPASGEHVPPAPRRWPSSTYAKAAEEYESWLMVKQAQDPARSAEWSEALKHARDFYP